MTSQSGNSSRLADFMDICYCARGTSSRRPPLLLQPGTLQLLQRLFISCARHEDGRRLRIGSQADDKRPTISLAPFNDGSTDNGGHRTLPIGLGDEFVDLTLDAKAATAAEHAMSVRDALRLYPEGCCVLHDPVSGARDGGIRYGIIGRLLCPFPNSKRSMEGAYRMAATNLRRQGNQGLTTVEQLVHLWKDGGYEGNGLEFRRHT